MTTPHQYLPNAGPARAALREKGQFWTPDWIAEAMAAYVLADDADHVFDPAVGAGAFFRAVKKMTSPGLRNVSLLGTEIDPDALRQAQENGLTIQDLSGVDLRDFVLDPPLDRHFAAIVANPPYLRHHRLSKSVKERLRTFGATLLGRPLDGRAGLHVYFLLRALRLLAPGGRLAFILPADVCEGVFAPMLWGWIAQSFRLDAVITFAPEASPFPRVDTNAIIFLIQNAAPESRLRWVRCKTAWTDDLKEWVLGGMHPTTFGSSLEVHERQTSEALVTGLSRPPASPTTVSPVLGDFARVLRGIATGDNDFFFLTRMRAAELALPAEFLQPAVGRTRDVCDDMITEQAVAALEHRGRPTLLFAPDGRPLEQFPPAVACYLRQGEAAGLPQKALIGQRRPWYKMEVRLPPLFLFAYLGRRNARFIRNAAGVVPLTGFLCVYPKRNTPDFVEGLWKVLQHPETMANLTRVGKSYGSGAIKVEPRALERLPLPLTTVLDAGLVVPRLLLESPSPYQIAAEVQ